MDTACSMVTKAMKHTLIMSTTTFFGDGGGTGRRVLGGLGERFGSATK